MAERAERARRGRAADRGRGKSGKTEKSGNSERKAAAGGLRGIFAADVRVFRFYPDGTVLAVLVKPAPGPEDAARIAEWLRPEDPPAGVAVAQYTLRGTRVAFTVPGRGREGEAVAVTGTWKRGALTLDMTGGGSRQLGVRFTLLANGP